MVLKIVIEWNAFHCQYIIERTTSRMCCVHIVKCYDIDTANGCSQSFLPEVSYLLIVCRITINFCNLKKAGIIRTGEMTQNNPIKAYFQTFRRTLNSLSRFYNHGVGQHV